jgi:hypothetical protein
MKKESDNLLPGHDLVEQGLEDVAKNQLTECALLVLIAAPRLRNLGIDVPIRQFEKPVEHILYERLEARLGADAHSHYNSLLRRLNSYAHALEREQSAAR